MTRRDLATRQPAGQISCPSHSTIKHVTAVGRPITLAESPMFVSCRISELGLYVSPVIRLMPEFVFDFLFRSFVCVLGSVE